jgi:hypothetical protein
MPSSWLVDDNVYIGKLATKASWRSLERLVNLERLDAVASGKTDENGGLPVTHFPAVFASAKETPSQVVLIRTHCCRDGKGAV